MVEMTFFHFYTK